MSDGGDARGSEDGTGPVSPAAPAPDAAPALAWEAGPGAGLVLPRRLALVLGSTTLLAMSAPVTQQTPAASVRPGPSAILRACNTA